MPKFRVTWTEYRNAIVEAEDADAAYEKVHDTEEYDKDNSLVDLRTTGVEQLRETHE